MPTQRPVRVQKQVREPLTRDRVMDAAMQMADANGLDAVTMRGLARVLNVEPMSLYHYAASRDEIVDGIVDRVIEQMELPAPSEDWRVAIRAAAISAHDVLRAHPWACAPLMAAPRVSAARLRQIDALLAALDAAQLPPQLADLAYHAIDSHILGFTMWEAGYSSGPALSGDDLAAFLERIHIERYPNLQAHAMWHLQPRQADQPNEFEFGLELILAGVERARVVHS